MTDLERPGGHDVPMTDPTPYEAMRLFAEGLLEELEDEHSCTEVALYRQTLADIEAEARSTPAEAPPPLPEFVDVATEEGRRQLAEILVPGAHTDSPPMTDHPTTEAHLRAALERLLSECYEVVPPPWETPGDWDEHVHEPSFETCRQAVRVLAALPQEPLDVERIVRRALAIVDQTTPLSVGEPLVQRVLARLRDGHEEASS